MGSPVRAPSLFDVPEGEKVHAIQADQEARNAEWMAETRRLFAFDLGMRDAVSTDDLWAFMEARGIDLPEGASPNLLGSFFSGWDRAERVGMIRSRRPGSGGNYLNTWRIR